MKWVLLALESESLDQYNTKSSYVWKNYDLNQIFDISNIIKTILSFFVNFRCGCYCPKSMFIFKAPTSRYKEAAKNFLPHCVSICINSKSMSEVFKIIFSTGDINIFDDGGSISVLYFQIKSSFSCEKRHPL